MLIITIQGISLNALESNFHLKLSEDLKSSITCISNMKTKKDEIKVFFIEDILSSNEVIFASISDTSDKTGKTIPVLKEVVTKIGILLKTYFEKSLVEIVINTIDPRLCWSSSEYTEEQNLSST